jgi:endonuclease YncB( thermonuclease family)
MTGTEWQVEDYIRAVDGDTVRLVRRRTVRYDGLEQTTRDADPAGVSIRLVWVDTPERGHVDYKRATADLKRWVMDREDAGLRVFCYESAGWDRLLGDLLDADGNSASQHLMIDKGWPPYEETR